MILVAFKEQADVTGPRLQPKWSQCHRVQNYMGLIDLWTDHQMQVLVEKRIGWRELVVAVELCKKDFMVTGKELAHLEIHAFVNSTELVYKT